MATPSPSRYGQLVQAAHIDVDRSGELTTTTSQNILYGKYSYSPHEYAHKTLTAIQKKISTANDQEKKDLQELANKVWTDYNKLQAAHRQKTPKQVGILARFIIAGTKFFHAQVKDTHNVDEMRQLYAAITEKPAPTLRMGKEVSRAVDEQVALHRIPGHDKRKEITAQKLIDQFKGEKQERLRALMPANDATDLVAKIEDPQFKKEVEAKLGELAKNALGEYSGKNNITATQTVLFGQLQKTAPKDWDVYKNGTPKEKERVDAFLQELEFKLQLDVLLSKSPQEMAASIQDPAIKRALGFCDPNKPFADALKTKELQPHLQAIFDLVREKCRPLETLKDEPIGPKIENRKKDDSIKVLTIAHLKEIAARTAYRTEMPKKIAAGFYNPAVIPNEIRKELGVREPDYLPPMITSEKLTQQNVQVVKTELRNELERIKGHLTHDQLRYVRNDINELMNMYTAAYETSTPPKTMEQAYILGRDALRAIVYQEIHDKGSFTGSDHGSKHVHHNCQGADGLHHGMHKGDFNAKDQFLEHLIHMYHDMGYTPGLAATNFDCCKDHPFIGAKMIEENKEYFTQLLDEDAYEALHDSILCHAIAIPDLQPDSAAVVTNTGFHPSLVRSVTSISDACAVTYDRKTQEFWEQPESIIALSRLRIFLTQYPQYMSILSSPDIIADEWANGKLNKDNPIDRMAHDVFFNTKQELLALADKYTLAPNMEDRRELFKQAINSQFNAFTAKVTLGQYGAVLHSIQSVENTQGTSVDPKYRPQLDIAPSIVYGVLQDLFGEDQAAQSFIKLLEEFGGDFKVIQKDVQAAGQAKRDKKRATPTIHRTGVVNVIVSPALKESRSVTEPDKAARKHMNRLQKNTMKASDAILKVQRSASFDFEQKKNMIDTLEAMRKGTNTTTFDAYVTQHITQVRRGAFNSEQLVQLRGLIQNQGNAFSRCRFFEIAHEKRIEQLKAALTEIKISEKDQKDFIAELEKQRASGFTNIDAALSKLPASERERVREAFNTIFTQDIKDTYPTNEKQFNQIRDMFLLAFMSDKEYDFMVGKAGAGQRQQVVGQMQARIQKRPTV